MGTACGGRRNPLSAADAVKASAALVARCRRNPVNLVRMRQPPSNYFLDHIFLYRCGQSLPHKFSDPQILHVPLEQFSRARVGLATHRTASLENNRCCPGLL